VGNTIANNIAEWNGNTWLALGSGITGVTDPNFLTGVFALAVSGSDLYAGGFFTTAGGSPAANIAKWDGNSWSALGSGTDGTYPSVGALAVMGSDLYAGGYFTTAGGSTVNCIAKWDGNSWSPLGTGISGAPDGDVPAVWALAVSGSDLYVGGSFTRAGGSDVNAIAKWDGNSWSALDSGLNGLVFALAASGTDLYAGGSFTTAGGSPANNIAKWDGSSWSPLDSGTAGTTPGTYGYVWALAVLGSDLYAGGSFSTAGGSAANYIAKWNGSKWTPLGSGMDATVRALVVSGSDLYAGGGFTTAGGKVSQSITRAYLLALPTLSVRSATSPAGEVTISWPSAGTDNFSLEQSDAPNTPASWISTSASITDDGITKSVTLPTTSGAQFFRLRRP
jgi:hypothetical protein